MAVVLRLSRIGGKGKPYYRVVVADSRTAVQGRKSIDEIGSYDPRVKNGFQVDMAKVEAWLGKGARPTPTVAKLLDIAKKNAPAKAEA
jgi:small subunit ribosomal protein S16